MPSDILIIPGTVPYPLNDGGKVCTFGLIDYLRKYNNIQILLYGGSHDKVNVDTLTQLWPDVIIHYVEASSSVTPLTKRQRTTHAIKNILRPLYKLLKGKNNKVSPDRYIGYEPFRSMPFFPLEAPFVEKLQTIIAANKFDIIQTEATELINLIDLFPVDAKKIFVLIESRGDILYDYGISHNLNPVYVKYVANNASFMEYAYMSRYNAVLALNDTDRIKIEQHVAPHVKVYTSPFGLLDKELTNPDTDNYIPENLIFIGGEDHHPNFDALNWFLTDVMAKFKSQPFKKIYVSGRWYEATRTRYKKLTDAIEFIGFVDDLTPYLKNTVSIVPIRIGGGGIRTKILFSMAHGSPVVSTSLGAVGITGIHNQELLITDEASDFANAITALFDDVKFTRSLVKNAYQLVTEKYSQSHVGAIRNKIYQNIAGDESSYKN